MGLKDKLVNQGGSIYSKYNGGPGVINPGVEKTSKLHAQNQPGYSLDGSFASIVGPAYNSYDDGVTNILPIPSGLDINGVQPSGPLSAPGVNPINNSFSGGTYRNNPPEGVSF